MLTIILSKNMIDFKPTSNENISDSRWSPVQVLLKMSEKANRMQHETKLQPSPSKSPGRLPTVVAQQVPELS